MSKDIFDRYIERLVENQDPDWAFVRSKTIEDADGFQTEYTWYTDGVNHLFMFGDSDIYTPDIDYADYYTEDETDAEEWFNSYTGFETTQLECLNKILEAMSPEDQADSDIIRSIIAKTSERTNAKLTPEEKEVMQRYGMHRFDRQVKIPLPNAWTSESDDDISNLRGGNERERHLVSYRNRGKYDPTKANYADIARKRVSRSQARLDRNMGDKITQYQDNYSELKRYINSRNYYKDKVDTADIKYQEALRKAREDYEKAIEAAEKARDYVDTDYRKQLDFYQDKINAKLDK